MNVCLIIPTGIGCEIGGHAGDGNPVAKLIAQCCDKLVTHPNVVNASDLNEMPANTLYVEGSILNRFLRGEIYLKEVFYNKILLAVNSPITNDTINAMNAAKVTLGAEIELMELETPLTMKSEIKDHQAQGKVDGFLELCNQTKQYNFDALAIQSHIETDPNISLDYLKGNIVINPWGGIEAITSKLIADKLDKPVAHAPFVDWQNTQDESNKYNEVVDKRLAPEMISNCYLHSVLKGLHQAPQINYEEGLSNSNIDFLITPAYCIDEPHYACLDNNIPVIAVRNENTMNDPISDDFIVVDNYLEAAGVLMSYKSHTTPFYFK